MSDVASGLIRLHREQLVHRDVREPNTVVLSDPRPHHMLIDLECVAEEGLRWPEHDQHLREWTADTLEESR